MERVTIYRAASAHSASARCSRIAVPHSGGLLLHSSCSARRIALAHALGTTELAQDSAA